VTKGRELGARWRLGANHEHEAGIAVAHKFLDSRGIQADVQSPPATVRHSFSKHGARQRDAKKAAFVADAFVLDVDTRAERLCVRAAVDAAWTWEQEVRP
jgi:hypothetical protein